MAPKTPRTPRTPQSPSKIIVRVDWKVCGSCNATFTVKDSLRHEAVCPVIASKEFNVKDMNHGFILDKKIHGQISEEPNCIDYSHYAVKVQKSHVALISPSAMQLCGIQIGTHILFEACDSTNTTSTFLAWPCSHIYSSDVFVDPEVLRVLSLEKLKNVRLSPIDDKKRVASRIVVRMASPDGTNMHQLEGAFLYQFDGHVVFKGVHLVLKYLGKKRRIIVESVSHEGDSQLGDLSSDLSSLTVDDRRSYYLILPSTKVSFNVPSTEDPSSDSSSVDLSDFGGSHEVVEETKKLCSNIFLKPTNSKNKTPRGMLLYGPPGTGKTLLCKALASHFSATLITIQGPELFSKYYGETETRLRGKFDEAVKNDRCIIFLDEIDALCPKRDSGSSSHSDQERRVVATLLSMMDSIPLQSKVVVIGATNRPDALDSTLRRPGRLDREMEIRAPTVAERKEIINVLLKKIPHSLEAKNIDHLASVTHGFVGADLLLLCAEASLAAAKRVISSNAENQDVAPKILAEDAKQALHLVKPSAMREVLVEVPDVRWTDIGGQKELKLKLKQAVEWPLRYPEAFKRLGVDPPRGLLMFGPPGCSKTMIAKALATESGLNFIAVKGPELFSKWVGESERAVREVFRRARQVAPAIVFLDELDALGSARGGGSSSAGVGDRVLAQLLTEMDGIEALKDVTVVAATNRPDMIDKALLRPGRLDRIVYVSLPDAETRREILQLKFNNMPIHSEVLVDWLVDKTPGYSGAEVSAVCNEAALRALEEDISTKEICKRHFDFALTVVTPRITSETVAFYENYIIESGMHAI